MGLLLSHAIEGTLSEFSSISSVPVDMLASTDSARDNVLVGGVAIPSYVGEKDFATMTTKTRRRGSK